MSRPTSARIATIALLGLLALSGCGHDAKTSSAPKPSSTPSSSPSYYAPGVPYVQGHTLYIGHRAQPGSWLGSDTRGAYTAATRNTDSGALPLVILRDSEQIASVPDVVAPPTFSPYGTKLAWITVKPDGTGTLVVQDLIPFRRLGNVPIQVFAPGKQGFSSSVDVRDDGTAIYQLGDNDGSNQQTWRWRPGHRPVRVPQPDSPARVNPPGFAGVTASVSLSLDHLWGSWIDRRSKRLTIQKPGDPSSRFTIALPAGVRTIGLTGWNSPTVTVPFLNVPNGENSDSLGCSIVTKTCAVGQTS